MAWYGPQGDCGCCDKGPCDPVGLVLDDFTTVDPRWKSWTDGNAIVDIDTGKPGIFMALEGSSTNQIPFAGAYRCHQVPTGEPELIIRSKFKASDFETVTTFGGYYVEWGLNFGDLSGGVSSPVSVTGFRNHTSGIPASLLDLHAIVNGADIQLSLTEIEDGDIAELVIHALLVSGNIYNIDFSWQVNNTEIHTSSSANVVIPESVYTIYQIHQAPSGFLDVGGTIENYTQEMEFEAEVIPP